MIVFLNESQSKSAHYEKTSRWSVPHQKTISLFILYTTCVCELYASVCGSKVCGMSNFNSFGSSAGVGPPKTLRQGDDTGLRGYDNDAK